jgi:hypothetical protein
MRRGPVRPIVTSLLFIASALPSSLLHAQSPASPAFKIATATGKTTFFLGERIPLALSFTGPADTYNISLFNFGRGDPMGLDTFEITPVDGWSDSLVAYFAFTSFGCCGAKQSGTLSAKPTTLNVNLNEWARFDEPGTYTVSIVSHRVTLAGRGQFGRRTDPISLRSNLLQLHIVAATAEWQRTTLKSALHVLGQPHKTDGEIPPERRAAIEDLRYLASAEAIPVLAMNLRDDRLDIKEDVVRGLIGLPRFKRDAALAAMNHLIDDPVFPVSADFLKAMPFLELENERLPVPNMSREEYEAIATAHEMKVEPIVTAAWERVAQALPRKIEPARAVTAQTLVTLAPENPSPTATAQLGAILRESFPALSPYGKARLLSDSWDTIGARTLLPQLSALAKAPPSELDSTFGFISLRAVALERWYEFEPENATREILRQIGSATPTLTASDIDYLPEPSLPQFEMLWANAFNAADPNDFSGCDRLGPLLVRFGTGAAAQPIAAKLRSHGYSLANCSIPAFAYLVKFDPQAAKGLIANANGHPPANLAEVAKFVQSPLLSEAALTELDNPDPNVVGDGLRYLGRWDDDEAVRQAVLDHYLKWAERWSAIRVKQGDDEEPFKEREERSLGTQFVYALLASQGWIADAALIATVEQHCLDKGMCDEVKRLAEPNHTVVISHLGYETAYDVGNVYVIPTLKLFEAKLDQYPKGTTFTLGVSTESRAAQRKLEASLVPILEKHGMKLGSQPR